MGAKDGHLYGVNNGDALQRWRSDPITWVLGGPAATGDLVVAGTSDERAVIAYDGRTGAQRWRAGTLGVVWTSPSVAGDMVYAADGAGMVYGLNRLTGERAWTFRAGGPVYSSPVPADEVVVFGSDDGGVYALRQGPTVQRAVFWDSAMTRASWYQGHRQLRDYLGARGYEVVDAVGLEQFIGARLSDGAPSVVVFAIDHLPDGIAPRGEDAGALRRYLDAGGKVVWVGVPPLIRPRDPDTGRPPELSAVDREATRRLLAVSHAHSNFDTYGAFPTPLGRRWGLDRWWAGRWAADPVDVMPLAIDENGLAPAWVKAFGGEEGTGFVRIWGTYAALPDPRVVHTVAEYRPGRGGAGR